MSRVAIIGTGISAMAAAWALKGQYDITFYEKEHETGGHTNTLSVDEEGRELKIDSAFMVYNETTYPLLTKLFAALGVETKPTDMSFSVSHQSSSLEFCGTGLNGLFAQRRNILNVAFWRMLSDINRFRLESQEVLTDPKFANYSLVKYSKEKGYSQDFLDKFLVPMSSAVWSTPADGILHFPIASLVRFFTNHCFLGLEGHLKWRTCIGGSRQYRDKLLAKVKATIKTSRAVTEVRRVVNGVSVTDISGEQGVYDHVILACHADEALAILSDATDMEKDLLSKFPYHHNRVTLHTDEAVMPRSRRAWSSWNYRIEKDGHASTIYWMNSLQGVSDKYNYFISINDPNRINPAKIIRKMMYSHPVYRIDSQAAQAHLPKLNTNGKVFFAGAYFRYGFHEDGLMAGLAAANALAGKVLWP